jgi:hypothetical protein
VVSFRLILSYAPGALRAHLCALIAVMLFVAGCNAANVRPDPAGHLHPLKITHPAVQPAPSQLGIDVLWYYDHVDSTSAIVAKAADIFRYIRSLGGNAVSLSFPFYLASFYSSRVYAGYGTPSPWHLATVVRLAKRYGLRVTVRPVLDGASLGHHWRGTIRPRSRREWFATYFDFLRPYLTIAQATGATEFQIGVELDSLTGDSRWGPLLAAASKLYRGTIGYSNNWNIFSEGALAPRPVTSQGIDAYFPTDVPSTATVSDIVAAWNGRLVLMPTGINFRKAVITEIGIPAQDGAYEHPYSQGNGRPIDVAIQRRWFAAGCALMRQWEMAGIYYWFVDFNNPPGSSFNPAAAGPTSFVGRSSAAIRACFRSVRRAIPVPASPGTGA